MTQHFNKIHIIFFLTFLFSLQTAGNCADRNITTSDGLSSNYVNKIIQDKRGFIWIGTEEGLNKYDGYDITVYRHNPASDSSLIDNFVWDLYEDDESSLWIATSGGLDKLDCKRGKFTHFLYDSPHNNNVVFAVTSMGKYLLVSTGNGLALFDKKLSRFKYEKEIFLDAAKYDANSLYTAKNGIVWAETKTGLFYFSVKLKKWIKETDRDIKVPGKYICTDQNAGVWTGTRQGVKFSDPGKSKWKTGKAFTGSSKITAAAISESGKIFAAAANSGITIIGNNRDITRRQNNVNSRLQGIYIRKIVPENDDTLWLVTDKGLILYRTKNGNVKSFTEFLNFRDVRNIVKDKGGVYWVATFGGGINRFNLKNNRCDYIKPENNPLTSNLIRDICIDHRGGLWFASDEGLINYDKNNDRWKKYTVTPANNNSLSCNSCTTVMEDSRGIIWAGTRMGISCLDTKTEKWQSYGVREGLPNDYINKIVEDSKGMLWISTNKGIAVLDRQRGKMRSYDSGDGLLSDEYTASGFYDSKNNLVYFIGSKGICYFNPGQICMPENISPTVITSFKVFNRNRDFDPEKKEVTLSYNENYFSFDFATLDYRNSAKLKYAYKLEGYDKDWIYCGNRRYAAYTNLNGGKYIFKVKGTNSAGLWQDYTETVTVNIEPPFWQTAWFEMLAVMAAVTILYAGYRTRIRKFERQQKFQQELSRSLIENQETERKRIAAELHDSIGQDLLVIKNFADITSRNLTASDEKASDTKENLSEISSMASEALEDVRVISRNLRPYQIDRLGISKALESMVKNIDESSEIDIHLTLDNIDGLVEKEQEIHIYRIMQECLNNVLKHSGGKNAVVAVNKDNDKISITVSDNGKGFDLEKYLRQTEQISGFGLSGISERVKMLNGKAGFNSVKQKGTEIKISIPVCRKNQEQRND